MSDTKNNDDQNQRVGPDGIPAKELTPQKLDNINANPVPDVILYPDEPKVTDTLPDVTPVADFASRAPDRQKHRLGYIKDKKDSRDKTFKLPPLLCEAITPLPPTYDLRTTGNLPTVYDQGDLGSCVAQATAALLYFLDKNLPDKDAYPDVQRSRLHIYYNARLIEKTVASDDGCMIRDAFKGLHLYGVAPETDWPYVASRFADAPPQAVTDLGEKLIEYKRVTRSIDGVKTAVAAGYPVVVGLTVYDSFEGAQASSTGLVPMPNRRREEVLGGHAVLIVGYNDVKKLFTVRNSWGDSWGDHGYFYLPYDYIKSASLASDFWTATRF